MKKIIVVGGGAAGMMAAVSSAQNGAKVVLIEKNEKLGKKIYITGKGRCNLTNAAELNEFFDNIFTGKEFSYSSMYGFDSSALLDLLKQGGLETKIERGNRVFPLSDKASDVTKALVKLLNHYNVEIMLNTDVKELILSDGVIDGIRTDEGRTYFADSVILCCGGKSYPLTGSDGSGYTLAKRMGHTMIDPMPALVPLLTKESWVHSLAGLSLTNVSASLFERGTCTATQFGEMLFTHKGISGPIILSLSCLVQNFKDSYVSIDLKPALDEVTLEQRILRDFDKQKNKMFKNGLDLLVPKTLAEQLVMLSGIDPEKKINQITVQERKQIVHLFKDLRIKISATAGFEEAIITKGGINTKEINPSSMESKLIKGLFFAGEIINVHGYTGGYNLQLAFSTGHLAGESAAKVK